MRKIATLLLTLIGLGIGHWIISYLFKLGFVDISIPFGGIAIFLVYTFTNQNGIMTRQMDMQIQGQTGIKMNFTKKVSSTSFVLIGSAVYFLLAIVATFIEYKDYFVN